MYLNHISVGANTFYQDNLSLKLHKCIYPLLVNNYKENRLV